MNKISIVVSAYNEEKNLKNCLDSVHALANEIIVVDNESLDKTAEIAKQNGAVVFSKPNNLMLNTNKNFGFSKAVSEWILNLDADEEVTPELVQEIKKVIAEKNLINGYKIPRKNIIFGKWIEHSLWWPDKQLRLFKNGKGKFPEKHVHESLEVEGNVSDLKNPMTHINYTSTSQFINKMDKIYTENEAINILKEGKKIKWDDSINWPVSDFLKNYFHLKGYKDGLHGLVVNLLQSFCSEVVFSKIWEKNGFKEENISLGQIEKIFCKLKINLDYWIITSKIEESNNPLEKIILKIKRKLLNLK